MLARSRFLHVLTLTAFALAATLAVLSASAQDETLSPRIENPAAQAVPNAPAADAASDIPAADPADQQNDLAFRLYPSLLEMGLDVGFGDDQARSVLAAVNGLRRQDNQRPFAELNDEVVSYVEQKVAAWRTQRSLTIRIQGALDALGLDPGPIDGIYGPLTTEAVRRYQRDAGMAPNGVLTAEQVDALEMKSIDRLMKPQDARQQQNTGSPKNAKDNADQDPDAVVATPAKAPEIDPDLLDYIGRQ